MSSNLNNIFALHGFLGSHLNFKFLEKSCKVDLRNHGYSMWSTDYSYRTMSRDVLNLVPKDKLRDTSLVGYSMGGKVALDLVLTNTFRKAVIIDIAPTSTPLGPEFRLYVQLLADLVGAPYDKDALYKRLSQRLGNPLLCHYLLYNLYKCPQTGLTESRVPLELFDEDYFGEIASFPAWDSKVQNNTPILVLKASHESLITETGINQYRKLFSNFELITIPNTTHKNILINKSVRNYIKKFLIPSQ